MRFLFDENFPKAAAELLVRGGHEVFDVRGTPKEGAGDEKIFDMAQSLKAVLLTTDKDFFHTIPRLFEHHTGVIVIAIRQPNRRDIIARLASFLDQMGISSLEDSVFMLKDHRVLALILFT